MTLNAEQLLSVSIKPSPVEVPELGGMVYVRSLSGAEFDSFRESIMAKKGDAGQKAVVAKMVCAATSNESGERLFTDSQLEQVNAMPSKILMRLFRAAQDQNSLGDDDTDELVKN